MSTSSAESLGPANAAASQPFVINLCSSTSPMALAHPSAPELKRYTFFVSRQREDGRERFRLHMGYFASQEEAEQLLAAVRDVYPAAWAGPAPTQGVARRGRISPVQLAPAVAQAASAAAAPVAAPIAAPIAAPAVATAVVAAARPAADPPAAPVEHSAGEARALEQTMSEMRNVLAHLGEDSTTIVAPTVEMPQPPPPVLPMRPIDPPRLQPVVQPRVAAALPTAVPTVLSPAQTLKVLELPAPPAQSLEPPDGEPKVRVLTPEDTQTLTDIKLDKANNAPPCFAVQLAWSVTPIDVSAMPHMAIFDAYTLYNVEGNRQGRKWYGLRLGFFSDPNSATQVANYVRGDYRSVAVIPVAVKERDRARGGTTISPADSAINPPLRASDQLSTNRETMDGFELMADDQPMPKKRDLDMPKDPAAAAAAVRARLARTLSPVAPTKQPAARVPGKATGKPGGKRVVVRKKTDMKIEGEHGAAAVLESTLDILGASTLTLDEGNGMVLDEAAARSRAAGRKKPADSKFSKLLSRLSGG
jgi:hypothetical protein